MKYFNQATTLSNSTSHTTKKLNAHTHTRTQTNTHTSIQNGKKAQLSHTGSSRIQISNFSMCCLTKNKMARSHPMQAILMHTFYLYEMILTIVTTSIEYFTNLTVYKSVSNFLLGNVNVIFNDSSILIVIFQQTISF